jgi:hypothetical protein
VFGLLDARLVYFRSPLAPGRIILPHCNHLSSRTPFFPSITARVDLSTRSRYTEDTTSFPMKFLSKNSEDRGTPFGADMRRSSPSSFSFFSPYLQVGYMHAHDMRSQMLPTCRRDDGSSQRSLDDDDDDDHPPPAHRSTGRSVFLQAHHRVLIAHFFACLTLPYLAFSSDFFTPSLQCLAMPRCPSSSSSDPTKE